MVVTAVDISGESLRHCRGIENCHPVQADLGSPLPFRDRSYGMVLASLSLHYFSWRQSLRIMEEVRRVLRPGGMLLMRLNSIEDLNYGAGQGTLLEENFYRIGDRTKRFFDERAVTELLADFDVRLLRHTSIDRYEQTKKVWEAWAISGMP
ncbi:MAG: class I SAM-dependent methyltransferase [Pseudomonadales bacterium]|nr:class I SAM-dependent methyltransferase [Pseudomonadales bacterium]